MKIRVFKILITIFLFQFIASCCNNVKFYDFDKMVTRLSSTNIALKDTLSVNISPVEIKFISLNLQNIGFSSALAFDCDDGWGGMKFPFEKIEISSNKDFDSNHLSNQLLNDLFKMKKYKGYDKAGDNFELVPINLSDVNFGEINLVLSGRPKIVKKHIFKIRLVKSNKEEIVIETNEIEWY